MSGALKKMNEIERQILAANESSRVKGWKITIDKRKRVKGEDGTYTLLEFSDGTSKRIQRMNSQESNGLPGRHDVDGNLLNSYIADSETDAIGALLRKKNRG